MPSPPQSHVSDGSPVNDAHPAQAFNCVFNRKEDGFPAFFHALYQPDTDVFECVFAAGVFFSPASGFVPKIVDASTNPIAIDVWFDIVDAHWSCADTL